MTLFNLFFFHYCSAGSKNLSKVDIGLPPPKSFSNLGRSAKNQYLKEIKNNNELEKKSRNLQCNVQSLNFYYMQFFIILFMLNTILLQ